MIPKRFVFPFKTIRSIFAFSLFSNPIIFSPNFHMKPHIFASFPRNLLRLAVFLLLMPACSPVNNAAFVPGRWYVAAEQQIALHLDNDNAGNVVKTDKAVSDLTPFTIRQHKNRIRFVTADKTLKRMGGRADTAGRQLVVKKCFGRKTVFQALPVRPAPQPPFRYTDDITPNTLNVLTSYGKAAGYYTSLSIEDKLNVEYTQILLQVVENIKDNLYKSDLDLSMDLYMPESDTLKLRPLVLLIHGGGFIAGDKSDKLQRGLATMLARKGFVVASINYRMGFVFLPGAYSNLERAMYRSVQDVRAALRYLAARSEQFRIDPDQVYLGGNSAGGFLSLMTAFMEQNEAWPSAKGSRLKMQNDLGCLDCSGNNDQGKYSLKGVINMWGALPDIEMMDAWEKIPVLLIHGDADLVVPYDYGYPFSNVSARMASFFTKKVYGSLPISRKANELGIYNKLIRMPGEGHEPHINSQNEMLPAFDSIAQAILPFVYEQLAPALPNPFGPISIGKNDPVPLYNLNQASYRDLIWDCEGGVVLSEDNRSARIVWFSTPGVKKIKLFGIGKNHQIGTGALQIHIR